MNAPVPIVRENTIAFCCGKKQSGKSTLLYQYFVANHPRTLSIDTVGEVQERNPNAIVTVGVRETIQTMRDLAASGVERWHIAAVFDEYTADELPQLFRLLCPPYSPKSVSLSRALGGIALECSECDVILPNGGASVEARNMIKRGRHDLLSLFLATQRPQECSRLCTSQADWVISFRMHEPREIQYLSRTVSERYADIVRNLPLYSSAWYNTTTGQVTVRDKDGATVKTFELSEPEGQLTL